MGTVILLLGGIGALAALAYTVLSFTKRRVPLAAWVAIPLLTLATGAAVTWIQDGHVLAGASSAGAKLAEMASSGLAQAWAADYLAREVAAALLIFSAWGAALGALRTGKYALWTPFAAVMTLLTAVIGAGVLAVYGRHGDVFAQAITLIGVVLVGGFGVSLGALRRAYYEHAYRVAGLRFTSAVLYFLGVVQVARGQMLGAKMDIYSAQGTTAPDQLAALATDQLVFLHHMSQLAWIAIIVAGVAACWAFMVELGDVVQRYTIFDGFAASALLVLVVGVRVAEITRADTTQDIALLEPVPELLADLGSDLPASSVSLGGNFYDAHFPRNGFGDVLVWDDKAKAPKKDEEAAADQGSAAKAAGPATMEDYGGWVRKYKWNGKGWDADDTLVDQADLYQGLDVLLAIKGNEPATPITDVLEKLGGHALLLLRTGELNLDQPPEVSHLQGQLLPIKLSTNRDLSKELWVDADRYDLYYGPIRLYGEGADEKDLVMQMDAVRKHHDGLGNLDVVVGDKTRVSNVAELCVTSEVDPGDEEVDLRGGWCALSTDDVLSFIAEADHAVQLQQPDDVTVNTRTRDFHKSYEASLQRELPAFAYCGVRALDDLDEGQELRGNLKVDFTIEDKGRVGDYEWDEHNIDSRTLRTCVKARIDKIRFPVPEVAEADQAKKDDGAKKDDEPKEPGKMEMTLTWR